MIYCAGDCVNSNFRNYALPLLTMVVSVCKDTFQSIQPTLSCPKFCFEAFAPDGNTVNASPRLFLLALGDNKYAFCWVQGTHNFGRDYFRSTSLVTIGIQWDGNEHEGISRVWRWLHRNLTQCSCKYVLHLSPSFLGMKVHHLEIAKLKLFCVIYT